MVNGNLCVFMLCSSLFQGFEIWICPFNDKGFFLMSAIHWNMCTAQANQFCFKVNFKLLVRLAYHCCPVSPSTSSVVFICCSVNLLMWTVCLLYKRKCQQNWMWTTDFFSVHTSVQMSVVIFDQIVLEMHNDSTLSSRRF